MFGTGANLLIDHQDRLLLQPVYGGGQEGRQQRGYQRTCIRNQAVAFGLGADDHRTDPDGSHVH